MEGGKQTFQTLDEKGGNLYITVEEIQDSERVAAGSYRVTASSAGAWNAGFIASIVNNKFTSANSAFYTVVAGGIRDTRLGIDSTTQASYRFTYQIGVAALSTGVRAYISAANLYATKYNYIWYTKTNYKGSTSTQTAFYVNQPG